MQFLKDGVQTVEIFCIHIAMLTSKLYILQNGFNIPMTSLGNR